METPGQNKDEKEGPETSDSLDYLWSKFNEEKFDEVIKEATDIVELKDNTSLNEALRLLGLSYFRQGQFNLSEQAFIKLSGNSTNPDDWFNLVTSSTLNKNIELSESACLKTIALYLESGTKENLPIPQVHYYYMQGLRDVKEYQRAFRQLEKLKEIYCKLGITDSTFLYMRGVPFLSHTMEAGKEILENIEKKSAETFIAELSKNLDQEGKQYLEVFGRTINYSSQH